MAFDQALALRLRQALNACNNVDEKKMFGGLCFMINGNILIGIWKEALIARIGTDAYEEMLLEPHVRPFDITGKPMKGWVLVAPEGIDSDVQLDTWVQRTLSFVRTLPAK